MTRKYHRPDKRYPKNWYRLRFIIFRRDNYRCTMCGRKLNPKSDNKNRRPVCHHIIPVGYGGSHSWDNLTTLCKRCHAYVHREHIEKKRRKRRR